jgi:hypothetical protein
VLDLTTYDFNTSGFLELVLVLYLEIPVAETALEGIPDLAMPSRGYHS